MPHTERPPAPTAAATIGLAVGSDNGAAYFQVFGPILKDVETVAKYLHRAGMDEFSDWLMTGSSPRDGWVARWYFNLYPAAEGVGRACAEILGRELAPSH